MDELLCKAQTSFFDFVELEDVFQKDNQPGRDIIMLFRSLSTSQNQADVSSAYVDTMNGLNAAHLSCRIFANSMSGFGEHTYIEEFKKVRGGVFIDFMKSLRAANKGCLINNYNMYMMSLPSEYSLRNNFWFAYALQA